jgi:hypothetical protein
MVPHYAPRGNGVKITRAHPKYGGTMEIDGDVREYFWQSGQRWVPTIIPDATHPASVGDMVTLTVWLSNRFEMNVAFVSGVRTIMIDRHSNGSRQVELLGLPCQWFGIGHFEEYRGLQIHDPIWGNLCNDTPQGKVVLPGR